MPLGYSNILGCLLGTAIGDACGLRREGLSPRRAQRMLGDCPIAPDLICGRGLCSDDTEHTLMVARAWAHSAGDLTVFQRQLARQFRCWLLSAPAGVGWATLRACGKLLMGFGPEHSGVWSAGNGPAMRSAILGLMTSDDDELCNAIRISTRITHTDPRAEAGALLIARAARLQAYESTTTPLMFLEREVERIEGTELRTSIKAVVTGLEQQLPCSDIATAQGWATGVSGYINRTVPAALYCWAANHNDFRKCVSDAVQLGGDSDTVAAIAGAVSGANLGASAIPDDWIARLAEWPRTVEWLKQMSHALLQCHETNRPVTPPSMHWPATLLRNALFGSIVLGIGVRRLFPPY